MDNIRNAIPACLSCLLRLAKAFKKISNNTIVPPPAFRPGLYTPTYAALSPSTNGKYTLFVDTGRNFALIKA